MRAFRFLTGIALVISLGATVAPRRVSAASNCADSTATLTSLFGWDVPADGWGIAVGTNGYVYVTDPVNDRICRYSLYGGQEMCWDSPDFPDPGQFVEPRWLAWNPINDRLYVSGQFGPPAVPVYSASGNFLFEIKGDSLSTEPGQFAGETWSIAIDPVTGYVWIHELNTLDDVTVDRIQEFNLNGTFTGRIFNRGPGCKLSEPFAEVEDIAVDSTGSVYLLDVSSFPVASEVQRVVPGTGCVARWGHDAGPGKLAYATNIAIDKDGFINVLDTNTSGTFVRKYNRAGGYIASVQIGGPSEDFSLALDFMPGVDDPFMYVARFDPNRVEVFGQGIDPRNILATSWVDPITHRFESGDVSALATCPTTSDDPRIEMEGVAADGVSPLLLRLHLPESGTVRWKISDPDHPANSEEIGSLANLDSTQTGNTVDTDVEAVDDEFIAFAVYTAPINFDRQSMPTDFNVGERTLKIEAVFQPSGVSDSVSVVRNLRIERPTVLFLHGFMENPDNWTNFQSIKTSGDAIRWGNRFIVADYSGTSGMRLKQNAANLSGLVESTVATARDKRRIADAQVDIVSHSMGGLVLRRLADATPPDPFQFKTSSNMGKGYYHKALFLNAPHEGAPLADIVVTMRDIMKHSVSVARRSTARWILEHYAKMAGADFNQLIDGGAIEDMSLGSEALAGLQPFVAPTHSHVGTGGSDIGFTFRMLKAAAKQQVLAFIGMITSFTNLPELALYANNEHDVAVLLDSQKGGLSNPFQFTTAHFEDGLHESSFFSDLSGEVARDWATTPVADATFFAPGLPGGASVSPPPSLRLENEHIRQELQDDIPEFSGVTLRMPNLPSFVTSGDSILVQVEPFSDVSRVVVSYPGGALFMDGTLTGYVHTDVEFVGNFDVSALALMADGTLGRSEQTTIAVGPPGALTGIDVTPPSVSLAGVGGLLALRVEGSFDDGVQRNVASASLGTTYSGFDPEIITVTPDGVVRGAGAGSSSLSVQNGPYTQLVSVQVGHASPINNAPQAIVGGPYHVCNGQGVTLDASGSFDFDGDALTYSWDLNGDGQFGDLTGESVLYSPPYIVDERLIALRVTDANGASSEDYTAIQIPLSCFEGERVCAANVTAYEASDLGTDGKGEVYIYYKYDTSGLIAKRRETCAFGATGGVIFEPEDLDEMAVDTNHIAYVAGDPDDEQVIRFGPGSFGELEPLVPVFTAPYSLVTGMAVDGDGNLYGSDYDAGAQHVFIRKFDQATPDANLLASWNLTTDAGITSAKPMAVAIGADGAIFVGTGNEVLKGVPQGGGYVLDHRWGSLGLDAGQFRGVSDVAVGPDGDVFVVDHGNHRVQRFASDGTFCSMRKGTNWPDGKFYHPTAVAVLDSTRVAVADSVLGGEPRIQIFYWGDAVPTSVPTTPRKFHDALVQNFPNPFNPTTTIAFSLARRSHVVLAIYDVRGALVRTLINGPQPAGLAHVSWDGSDGRGNTVSSGVYFYRLVAGSFQATRKMVLLK
jgi:pimeloyl-ACP methyl ester carboxylesterase